jgi:uncharacterized protein
MATSLYDLSVGCYLQTVGAVAAFLDRGLAHFTEAKVDPNSIVETRLFPDMMPLRFQVQSVAHHSLGAIEGIKKGQFVPPSDLPAHDYKGLQKLMADTRAGLQQLKPADVNALEGRDITFSIRDFKLPFTAENFILSFSLPNFHFHSTTTYDILRMKGVPLGKRDYMGSLRLKMSA